MDYFIMKTDKRLCRLPQMQMPKELSLTEITKEKISKLTSASVVYVKKNYGLGIEYPDYLERPIPLIADKLKKILQKYQREVLFHRVMLIEKEAGLQMPYFLMMPPEIICADSKKTQYDAGGNVQNFVLDLEKAEKYKIFLAKDYKQQIIVRLDVAESILRRNVNGIWFEPVKI